MPHGKKPRIGYLVTSAPGLAWRRTTGHRQANHAAAYGATFSCHADGPRFRRIAIKKEVVRFFRRATSVEVGWLAKKCPLLPGGMAP